MARSGETPDISKSNLEATVSSSDLLKQAWTSMGRTDAGDRIEDPSVESASGVLMSAANLTSIATTEQRASAEEIARVLRDTEREAASEARSRRMTPQRSQVPAPRPQAPPPPPPPRPRRQAPLQTPSRSPQPAKAPQPGPAPQPQRQAPPEAEPRPKRRGLAWLIFGLIWVIGAVIGAFADGTPADDTPDISIVFPTTTLDLSGITEPTVTTVGDSGVDPGLVTNMSIRDVSPGTCIASLPPGQVISTVATVPCSEPHQYELFASVFLETRNDGYPADAIFDLGTDACGGEFFDYVGETYAMSSWYIDVITPTEAGWNQANDRQVNCLLYRWADDAADADFVTGSARGTGAGSSSG